MSFCGRSRQTQKASNLVRFISTGRSMFMLHANEKALTGRISTVKNGAAVMP